MERPRLTKLVRFLRIKPDAERDEAGQVDESLPANWQVIGQHRGDCRQESSSEITTQDQQSFVSNWSVLCRGDSITRSISHRDRIEFIANGMVVTINATSAVTLQDTPQYIEFTGSAV